MHGPIAGWHLIYEAQVEGEHAHRLGDPAFRGGVEEDS